MKLSKFRIAAASAAFIVLAPAVAFAISPFTDIIPGKFYKAPVERALDNGFTTGKTATTFEPDSPVTRGESVTFLKRYHDNIIKQTVGSLDCTTDQITVSDGTIWTCGADQTIPDTDADTMADLICTANQVAHYDDTNKELKAFHCTADYDGTYSSITIGTDGFPIISYGTLSRTYLKSYHCTAVDCSSGAATSLDTDGTVRSYTSIAIGSDGLAIISYRDVSNNDLKAYHCTAIDCSAGSAITLNTNGDVGWHTSISIGDDDKPMIAYYGFTNLDLRFTGAHGTV